MEQTLLLDDERPWQKRSTSFLYPDGQQDNSQLLVPKDSLISMLREELRVARANQVGLPYPKQLRSPTSGSYYRQNMRKMKLELSTIEKLCEELRQKAR